MKFDGTDWDTVGTAGFTTGGANYISLAFHPTSNEPYIAYRALNRASVMRFNGTAWVNVGMAGFSARDAYFTSLAFNPTTGEPYVAYSDREDAGPDIEPEKVIVMMFDGTAWVNVGTDPTGFSKGNSYMPRIAFSSSGEPYVVYGDEENSGKATAMKFDGTAWVNVGTAGFSAGDAVYISFAFSPTGEPYVAYQDRGNSGKATVMKFIGSTTDIKEITSKQKIAVFPNPTNNVINFSIQTNAKLTNATGQIVANKTNTNSLDLSDQPTGIYFLTLTSDNGQVVQHSKIVKK